jgi:hypothetical protein
MIYRYLNIFALATALCCAYLPGAQAISTTTNLELSQDVDPGPVDIHFSTTDPTYGFSGITVDQALPVEAQALNEDFSIYVDTPGADPAGRPTFTLQATTSHYNATHPTLVSPAGTTPIPYTIDYQPCSDGTGAAGSAASKIPLWAPGAGTSAGATLDYDKYHNCTAHGKLIITRLKITKETDMPKAGSYSTSVRLTINEN